MQPKKIIMIAGPNGAGKTTFARAFLPAEAGVARFINADLIAAGLSPFAPETMAIKAGRLMLAEVQESVAQGRSFALETTLSGQGYLRHIPQWRAQGFRVSLYFLSLPAADVAVARVAERVRQGGHHIPEPVIRRRFAAGLENFVQRYRSQVDDWALYATGGHQPELCEWGAGSMADVDICRATHPDLRGSQAAMQRAAASARQMAVKTDTSIVLMENGRLLRASGEQLRQP